MSEYRPVVDPDGRQNVRYLKEHGPTPTGDLPASVSASDKMAGLWVFRLFGAAESGGSDGTGGHISGVAWLPAHHDEREVLGAFLDANPRLVEAKTYGGLKQMLHGHGSQWRDPVAEVLPRYYEGEDDG